MLGRGVSGGRAGGGTGVGQGGRRTGCHGGLCHAHHLPEARCASTVRAAPVPEPMLTAAIRVGMAGRTSVVIATAKEGFGVVLAL